MIDAKEKKKLMTHSKKHKGGMKSAHIRKMVSAMKKGDSFIVAHSKAMGKMKKRKY